jgi:hypothetical protein
MREFIKDLKINMDIEKLELIKLIIYFGTLEQILRNGLITCFEAFQIYNIYLVKI